MLHSEVSKLKITKFCKVLDHEFTTRYPALAAKAKNLDDTLVFTDIEYQPDPDMLCTDLDISKFPYLDITIAMPALLESVRFLQLGDMLQVLIRIVKLSDDKLRIFYYYLQQDNTTYSLAYIALIKQGDVGITSDINVNHRIRTTDSGFHPGVIALDTSQDLIPIIKALCTYKSHIAREAKLSFAFKKKVPISQAASHDLLGIKAEPSNLR